MHGTGAMDRIVGSHSAGVATSKSAHSRADRSAGFRWMLTASPHHGAQEHLRQDLVGLAVFPLSAGEASTAAAVTRGHAVTGEDTPRCYRGRQRCTEMLPGERKVGNEGRLLLDKCKRYARQHAPEHGREQKQKKNYRRCKKGGKMIYSVMVPCMKNEGIYARKLSPSVNPLSLSFFSRIPPRQPLHTAVQRVPIDRILVEGEGTCEGGAF